MTSKKIAATFQRQRWDSRNNTVDTEEVPFDATNLILTLSLSEIQGVRDNDESSDKIGSALVSHSGPHYVYGLEDAITEFFDVDEADKITQEMLDAAIVKYQPKPYRAVQVTLTVTLQMQVMEGVSVEDVLGEMDYSFTSATEGASINRHEIQEYDIREDESPAPKL